MGFSFDELKRHKEEWEKAEEQGKVLLSEVLEDLWHKWRRDTQGCPSDEELSAYCEGASSLRRKLAIWWHVRHCALCRADLSDLREALAVVAIPEPQPAEIHPPTSSPKRVSHFWPWIIASAEAFVILILLLQVHQLHMQVVREAITDGYRDTARLLVLVAKAEVESIKEEARNIQVIPAVAYGRTYPYPTLRKETPAFAATLVEGIEKSSALKTEYEALLFQWSEIFRALGSQLAEVGKIPEAIQVFEYLVQTSQEPKDDAGRDKLLGLYYGLGEMYKMNGDHRAAIAVYDTIIEHGLASNDPRPYHYAGWSYYYGLTEYEKALAYYDKALRIDPNYAKVFYNKALVFRDLGNERLYKENLERALKLTLQAYRKEGDANPRVTFSLAIFYTAKRELDEALVMLERSLQKERLYVIRAEKEQAFAVFRERANEPYYSRFKDLLDRYRPVAGTLGARSRLYDPTTYNE